jgi:hypothetical protein
VFPRGTRRDPNALSPGQEFPRHVYHATKESKMISSAREEAELGPGWSRTNIHKDYPSARYSWNGKTITVANADEDAALGRGWTRNPAAFDAYKGTRPARTEEQDPARWLDEWSVPGLSSGHRKKIKAQLLRADGAFERSPDPDSAALAAMRQAFDGIARVLFEAEILNGDLLRKDIPLLVWDSASAGGWWRYASETAQDIFPEQVGHYWVWRDESQDWEGLFRAETREWDAALLEAPVREVPESAREDFRKPEAGTMTRDRAHRPGKPEMTALGRNIDRLRLECGWSFDEISKATELSKQLILGHVNAGRSAYPSTLATYAHVFSEKLGRSVTVAELRG